MLQIEQVERLEMSDRQMVATFVAAGADVHIPEAGSYRAEFDDLLNREITESPRAALLRRLGG